MKFYKIIAPYLKEMVFNFKRLMGHFDYRILMVPPVIAAFLWIIMANGIIRPQKQPLEIAAVAVSGMFMLVAAMRYLLSRQAFFLWSSALFLLIMCREIHFAGTDQAIFIGLVILLGVILYQYDRFKPYLANTWVINLFVAGFFTYFLSQTVDQRWWRIIPGEDLVNVSLEESLEMIGHVMIGFAAVFCRRNKNNGEAETVPTA